MLYVRGETELFVDQVKSSGKVDETDIHRYKKMNRKGSRRDNSLGCS